MATHVPPPAPMDSRGEHLLANLKLFRSSYNDYEVATGLDTKPDKIRVATLRTVMGKDCLSIFKLLQLTDAQRLSVKFCLLFAATASKNISSQKSCECGTLCDDLVRDRIVLGTSDNDLRLRMFREKALTLHKVIMMARESEILKQQVKEIKAPSGNHHTIEENVNFMKKKKTLKTESRDANQKPCRYCGNEHQSGNQFCAAYGKTCKACKRQNHFAKVCEMKKEDRYEKNTAHGKRTDKKERKQLCGRNLQRFRQPYRE
eukprot:gene2125-2412_t